MNEYTPIETRRKSRSKTPFLRSSCDNEACAHAGEEGHTHERRKSPHVKKHPKVTAIIEEYAETTSPVKQNKQLKNQNIVESTRQQKTITTSDYSSNSSEDLTTEIPIAPSGSSVAIASGSGINNNKSSTTSTTKVITKSHNLLNNYNTSWIENGRLKPISNISRQNNQYSSSLINAKAIIQEINQKEISQNELNSEFEKYNLKTSTPIYNKQKLQTDSQDSINNLDTSPAYQEYKDAGEYWAKYPKTDYTYSKLSPHRREVVPGVVGMPNMSRKSLEKHHERINYMIDRSPEQELYIRSRYEPKYQRMKNSREDINVNHLLYDSQDELDMGQFEHDQSKTHSLHSELISSNHNMYSEQTWITKFMSFIVIMFNRFCNIFTKENNENYLYGTRSNDEEYFGNVKNALVGAVLSIFSYFYLLISSVLYLDTLFLKSTAADNLNKKRFLLLLLILLPLLLLAAWNLMEDHDRNKILLKAENLVPISLIGFRNIFPSEWKNIFNKNLWSSLVGVEEKIKPISSNHINYASNSITNNIQKSLSTEEYDNIINHVNIYVQKLIDDKLEKERFENLRINNKLSNDMKILIANTVRDNILALIPPKLNYQEQNYVLTDSDLELIVQEVQNKLSKDKIFVSGSQISFIRDNLDEISKLIKSQIEINYKNLNVMENIDIHEILFRIIGSPELAGFIDSRIIKFQENNNQADLRTTTIIDNDLINRQKLMIDELNNEIAFIKRTMVEKLNENDNLYQSIDMLKIGHNEFMSRFIQHEIKTNSRFDNLLSEIDMKLSNLNDQQFLLINKQIKLSLIDILGYNKNNNDNIDEIDLKNWIRNMFVAKEFLEDKLNELSLQFDEKLKKDIDRSGMIIMKDISEKLKIEILKAVDLKHKDLSLGLNVKTELAEEEIKKIVNKILAVYDADKTGLVDYALESAGGQILSTRCTENYHTKSAQISVFGIPLWYPSNTPRIAISPAVHPGECWAFQGFPGYLVLKLNTAVFVSGFTLEHIPKGLAPNGKIDSAPRNFTVWGLDKENDEEPTQFGDYEYSDKSSALQYFPVQNKNINRPFDIVELRIETNHGNLQYTCLYRFRVHGKPTT